MTSRLDRLFLLLESGSSNLTRRAAALQLGEVQRLHPHELHNLLAKVRLYLQSNSWDTRIAASQAVEAIVNNVALWLPTGPPTGLALDPHLNAQLDDTLVAGRMNFNKYDMNTVIKCGHNLLASEGREFDQIADNCVDSPAVDMKEKIAKQRLLLNQRLGLDVAQTLGLQIDSNDFVTNSDLTNEEHIESEALDLSNKLNDLDDIVSKATGRSVKRKAHRLNRLKSIEQKNTFNDNLNDGKRIKTEQDDSESHMSDEQTFDITQSNEWPLESFSDELMGDLFNPLWEVRHGAATALREIIKLQGKCGGRTKTTPCHQMDTMNQLWLEDLALRLVSVLALDRFGDYVSDQVVAPVRETCAQTLGLVLNLLTPERVNNVLKLLLQLLACSEWEARHGGMLGLKYLLAIRQDLTLQLIPIVFQPIFNGLKDSVDDVSAVSAAALVPVKDVLMEALPEKVPLVIAYLWDALLELDDLSSSTGDLVMLLSSLLTFNSNVDSSNLSDLVPRLWPFLSHSLSSVRKSVLEALLILSSNSVISWLTPSLLSDALRLLYQRCLLENKDEIMKYLYKVWFQFVTKSYFNDLITATCQHLSGWICLMMHPSKIPIDPESSPSWLEINHINVHTEQHLNSKYRNNKFEHQNSGDCEHYFIGGSEALSDSQEEREKFVTRARHQCAKFIALLAHFVTKPTHSLTPTALESFANILLFHLNSKSAIQRTCISWVIKEWAKVTVDLDHSEKSLQLNQSLSNKCLECLQEFIYYDEISSFFTRLQIETREFIVLLKQHKYSLDEDVYKTGVVYTFDQITHLANTTLKLIETNGKITPIETTIEDKSKAILKSSTELSRYQTSLSTCVLSSIAGALISWNDLPQKLNPIVRPLMDSLKSEENEQLQSESAISLVHLLKLCCDRPSNTSTVSPVSKIIKNLITYLCSDSNFTPTLDSIVNEEINLKSKNYKLSILTLENMQKFADKTAYFRRSNSTNAQKKAKIDTSASFEDNSTSNFIEANNKQNEILRRGAALALSEAAKYFGAEMPSNLPTLWELITQIMTTAISSDTDLERNRIHAQNLIQSLQVLEVIGPHLHSVLHSYLITLLTYLSSCLQSEYTAIRHMAARCFGMLSVVIKIETMTVVLKCILDLLEANDSQIKRLGAVEAIHCIIDSLALDIVPYIVLLIVPMLGRMSDQNDHVRLLATHCFAQLVQLMPLDNDNSPTDDQNTNSELLIRKETERHFLEQLMNIKKLDDYKLPIPVKAELRTYQTDGVNWLAFLNKYKLHGIVADEMGLGKTLQAICILASDHYFQSEKLKKAKNSDENNLLSIVICPPTLTGHWLYEVDKFVNSQYLCPLHYTGPPNDRMKLRNKIKRNSSKHSYNLVIASYDIVRNDIDFFSSLKWNYCILDEGHVIKNGKTKLAKAIKSLIANHRLILTGTPIQNNVLELWSLFDFLMPGFLGTERQFLARYSRPILQSRDAKSSSKEQEAGVLAMESLHRQVLPFILRRMKEDVLKDLPPKIMQDYYCELSPLQSQLYEDFAKSRARQSLQQSFEGTHEMKAEKANPTHIFQALQYLRKVCNHPKLVLSSLHPQYDSISQQLKQQKSSLSDINHATKLCALRQLLLDCGIGTQSSVSLINESEPVVNQHRALVFCQLKSMLDIVENDLLKVHMPSVTYLRLDGNVPPNSRHSVVHRFNNDPSIDILLLTTQVGGLGLNLTGADTVIFVEHDWNPMKDLQAMDRAHRIGQKKVVNVYRLITTGTLEEKIMGLQKFKLTIANTVISNENSSLQTMATDQLLDLFNLDHIKCENDKHLTAGNSKSGTNMKNVIESLPELWESEQYENEYDLTNFIQSLKS